MKYIKTDEIMLRAWKKKIVVPGFNIPYLPMMEPVVKALVDCNSFGLIMVARLEWEKFESGSLKAIRDEYSAVNNVNHTRLHLDHIPVIDEDQKLVDYEAIIGEALNLGYESVMVDASRLSLDENIDCTKKIVEMAKSAAVPVEAELGAVMGHESGPLPPYEELFKSKQGFTSPEETKRFVEDTSVDWLSVAIGNIHGAISAAGKQKDKPTARIDLEHLEKLNAAAGIPLVLHGGTGIEKECIQKSINHGIAKINVATAIRQPYERNIEKGVSEAQNAVYATMVDLLKNELNIEGSAEILLS